MSLTPRRRSAAAAALAFAASAAALIGSPQRLPAADPPAADWKNVPADAALFGYLNVAELWDSKIGETFRAVKAVELEKGLAEVTKVTGGITPDMLKTVTVVMPQLKGPADTESVAVFVTFRKPYDRAALVKAQAERLKADKVELTDKDGVIAFKPAKDAKVRIVAKEPTRLALFFNLDEKLFDKPSGDGPQSMAFKAAADGATAVAGLNLAGLPDEIRGDDIPAEARAFQPILRSDAAVLTGKLTGDSANFELRVRNQDKAKTADAEKSLAAGVAMLQALQKVGANQAANARREEEKAVVPLVKAAGEFLASVKVSVENTDAVATATTKTDLPFGPVLQLAFGGAVGPAGRARTQNNLKQLALAMHNYHDVYNGFPPAAVVSKKAKPMLSWRVMILPYVEQQALYNQFKLDEPWDSDHNKAVLEKNPMPQVYALPGVTKDGEKTTHFQVFVNNGAMFDPIQPTRIASITDGTSNTILIATAAKAVPWTKPDDIEFDPKADPRESLLFGTADAGCNVALGDGSVRFLKKTISMETLKALITKSGGEVLGDDF